MSFRDLELHNHFDIHFFLGVKPKVVPGQVQQRNHERFYRALGRLHSARCKQPLPAPPLFVVVEARMQSSAGKGRGVKWRSGRAECGCKRSGARHMEGRS